MLLISHCRNQPINLLHIDRALSDHHPKQQLHLSCGNHIAEMKIIGIKKMKYVCGLFMTSLQDNSKVSQKGKINLPQHSCLEVLR